MAAEGIHISIAAEPIFELGGILITNSMFTSVMISTVLILFSIIVYSKLDKQTQRPQGLQNFAELLVEIFYELTQGVTGNAKKTRLFLPPVMTFFVFIIFNNWFGLVPGVGPITTPVVSAEAEHTQEYANTDEYSSLQLVPAANAVVDDAHSEVITIDDVHEEGTAVYEESHAKTDTHDKGDKDHYGPVMTPIFRPGTADLNTTIALGIISVILTQAYGLIFNKIAYFGKFLNFSSPIMFFVGILELVSEFAKIISFAFRLFGNIFAGEVLLVVISFLVPLIVPMPFYGLEIFVGFIQALVFAMLSLVFFNMATQSHDH